MKLSLSPSTPSQRHNLTLHLRRRIVSGIHAGSLNPGDRLPNYREIADEFEVDLRRVARAYRELEEEGLVEVRPRSGVYVAPQQRIGGQVLAETARWMVSVLSEAWERQIHVPKFSAFAERCVSTVEVRCACVDSVLDVREAEAIELGEEFGFTTEAVDIADLPEDPSARLDLATLPQPIRDADLLVATAYHAPAVRKLAQVLGTSFVVLRLSASFPRQIARHVGEGVLVIVHVDPAFLQRVYDVLPGIERHRIRGVLADDISAVRSLSDRQPVMITRAAKRRLTHEHLPPPVSLGPTFSRDTGEALVELLVRTNLEAMKDDSS